MFDSINSDMEKRNSDGRSLRYNLKLTLQTSSVSTFLHSVVLYILTFVVLFVPLITTASLSADQLPQFTEITEDAGIVFVHNNGAFGKKYLPETMGSGCAIFDYNCAADFTDDSLGRALDTFYENGVTELFALVASKALSTFKKLRKFMHRTVILTLCQFLLTMTRSFC